MKPKERETEITITEVGIGHVHVALVGTTPLVLNRVSEKAKGELLAPKGRKTTAEKAQSLKHSPLDEFRNSPYTLSDDNAPTLLSALSVWFKRAMMTAALDVPGASKARIGRLVRAEGERIPLYGIPQMFMAVTRSADIGKTPDVRTRAIVPKWAVFLQLSYHAAALKEKGVLNLLAAAGLFSGCGDWRTEKGSGNYGSFRLAGSDDEELQAIVASGGRAAQHQAFNIPSFYDDETEKLFTWYNSTVAERGFKIAT